MSDKLLTLQGAELLYKSNRENIKTNTADIEELKISKIDGAYVSEDGKYLHLTSGDNDFIGPLGPFSGGGGGGGGGNNAKLTAKNLTIWGTTTSISQGSDCTITVDWSSIEDEEPTGDGTYTLKTANEVLKTANIPQGTFSLNAKEYLKLGTNKLYLSIKDVYENTKTFVFTVNVTSLSLTSIFNSSVTYFGNIEFDYTATGELDKTVYFELDGEIIGTKVVTTSGRQEIFIISKDVWKTHGHHIFRSWFTAVQEGIEVKSNVLTYDLICAIEGETTPIITSTFNEDTVKQYSTINIPFYIYNPTTKSSNITLIANGASEVRTNVPNNILQTWSYRVTTKDDISLTIKLDDAERTFNLTVSGSAIPIEPATAAMSLYLTSTGRSNYDTKRDIWEYNDIRAQFNNFNWTADGWLQDKDGYVALTVKGGATVTIPYQIFANDFRSIGKTIEFEFSTSDVNDYESTVISCFSGNRGLRITAQDVLLKSEQSEISTQFKEDEHVRISFVIDSNKTDRIIFCYINGIISGTIQYPSDDNFEQIVPVNITIGSTEVTTNVYNIRVYDRALTRFEMINNWICDKQDGADMLAAYEHNNIFDAYDQIVIDKLPADLPYMVLYPTRDDGSHILPQFKGDKVPCTGYYIDPNDPSRSFSFEGASANVQGTSSQGYPRKNYKISFKKGFDMIQSGEHKDKFPVREGQIPANEFTFKADFASSEGCNNVELVKLYNDLGKLVSPTPPQKDDDRVRQGIDGFPIVIFYNNGENISFLGKYNFNNDKGNEDVFGFNEGDESFEITSNVSDLAIWKEDDLDTWVVDEDGGHYKWTEAFEARYPDVGEDASIEELQKLSTWLVSTDRDQATDKPLPEPQYGYDTDCKEYRLAKYREEFKDHLSLESSILYYLFTELFLMIDSRAKNAFPTMYLEDGKWCWLPYDLDTAIGINNEGKLVFSYNLEDTDKIGGSDVFNGQNSVMWCNLRDAFSSEIRAQYVDLVSKGLTYDNVERRFEEHQAKWPQAIFNEDAYFKYIKPLISPDEGKESENYLEMCLGSKAEQRKWWLYNRFRYIDSKYKTGESEKAVVKFRAYSNGPITVVPYADIYARFRMGGKDESPADIKRAKKNEPVVLSVDAGTTVTDLDCYIFSADQLKDIGDLSVFTPDTINISAATKLQTLKVGKAEINSHLTSLELGSNVLLKTINCINCPNLPKLDASGCTNLEELYLDGCSKIDETTGEIVGFTAATLPKGGMLKKIHLPASITSLSIENQPNIEDLTLEGFNKITTLVFDTVSQKVQNKAIDILHTIEDGARVRLWNFNLEFDSVPELKSFITDLDRMKGINAEGGNEPIAQILGTITLNGEEYLDYEYIKYIWDKYQDVRFNCKVSRKVEFYSEDGVELEVKYAKTEALDILGEVIYSKATPEKEDIEGIHYEWDSWITEDGQVYGAEGNHRTIKNIASDLKLYAHFREWDVFTVNLYNYDGSQLLDSLTTRDDLGNYVIFEGELPTPVKVREHLADFIGWGTIPYGSVDIEDEEGHRKIVNIHSNLDIYAQMDWELISISVTPDTYNDLYFIGDVFDETGMEVRGIKLLPGDREQEAILTKYNVDKTPFEATSTKVRVNVGDIETFIPVGIANLTAILAHKPTKQFFYTSSETELKPLDFTGLQFEITFSNGKTKIFDYSKDDENWRHDPEYFFEEGYKDVYISYKNSGLTYVILLIRYIDDENLDNDSWSTIRAVCDEGLASQHWHVGQEKHIFIEPNSTYGFQPDARKSRTFRILGFNHNADQEIPVDENGNKEYEYSITFGLAKMIPVGASGDSNPIEICMNTNMGLAKETFEESWNRGCTFKEVCEALYTFMPSDLRAVMKDVIKGQSDQSWTSNPTPTPEDFRTYRYYTTECKQQRDRIFIPSVYEILGLPRVNVNQTSDESTVCKQFEYYKNSDPSIRQKARDNTDGSGMTSWWLRSFLYEFSQVTDISAARQYQYCYGAIYANGELSTSKDNIRSYITWALMPCFNV